MDEEGAHNGGGRMMEVSFFSMSSVIQYSQSVALSFATEVSMMLHRHCISNVSINADCKWRIIFVSNTLETVELVPNCPITHTSGLLCPHGDAT